MHAKLILTTNKSLFIQQFMRATYFSWVFSVTLQSVSESNQNQEFRFSFFSHFFHNLITIFSATFNVQLDLINAANFQ